MIISELSTSVECVAALFTLLFMGKLILESPFASKEAQENCSLLELSSALYDFSHLSFFGGAPVEKRSLLNQHVARRA